MITGLRVGVGDEDPVRQAIATRPSFASRMTQQFDDNDRVPCGFLIFRRCNRYLSRHVRLH
jgi:hypothetical protein